MRTMDAAAQAQLGFLVGNLTYIEQEVLRQPYPEIKYPRVLAVDTSAPDYIESIGFKVLDYKGEPAPIGDKSHDFPRAEIASKIVKRFDSKGLVSPLEIKRAALTQLKPTRDWAGKSEAYITAAFDSAEEDAKETNDKDDDEDAKATKDSLAGLAKDLKNRPKLTNDGSEAYTNFLNGVTK